MHVEYDSRPDGIHHFTFLRSTKQSVDEFCEIYYDVLLNHQQGRPFRLLADFGPDGVPNVNYLYQQLSDVYQAIGRDNLPYVRAVYMLADSGMIPIMRPFLELFRTQERRKFVIDGTLDEAVDWLLHIETQPNRPRMTDSTR